MTDDSKTAQPTEPLDTRIPCPFCGVKGCIGFGCLPEPSVPRSSAECQHVHPSASLPEHEPEYYDFLARTTDSMCRELALDCLTFLAERDEALSRIAQLEEALNDKREF